MDKQGNRFSFGKTEPTKIIDLDEANIKQDWADTEDIDTLYEQNESEDQPASDESTKVLPKSGHADKHKKDKKRSKPAKEKKPKDAETKKDKMISVSGDDHDSKHFGKDKKASEPEKEKMVSVSGEDPQSGQSEKEKKREERIKEKNAKKLEKLMKKKKKREEKSDREVLSYEDMPLEERPASTHKKPRKSGKKRIIAVVLILVVVFTAVFIFANSNKLSWHNIRNYVMYGVLNQKSDEQFPVSIQGENVDIGNFTRMGQDVCFASDTKLQIVNNYGRYEFSTQHGFLNPVLKASDQYALIYSLGGTGYQINDTEKTLFSGESEDRIVTGDINDKGTYAIVTASNGYLSRMQVYDKDNEKIFGYSFADYYVTSVSLAPNGKGAVVTGLSALNGSEISALYVLSFTKDKPVYQDELEENIFYDCKYLNDSYACAVGSGAACSINVKTGDVNTLRYEGKHLTCYCFNRDTSTYAVSLSRSGDGRNCEIFSFNTDGTVADSFETELTVKCISTYKGRVAVLTPDTIYLYTKNGDQVSGQEVSNEPVAIVMYTTDDAYVLDTNEINTMTI